MGVQSRSWALELGSTGGHLVPFRDKETLATELTCPRTHGLGVTPAGSRPGGHPRVGGGETSAGRFTAPCPGFMLHKLAMALRAQPHCCWVTRFVLRVGTVGAPWKIITVLSHFTLLELQGTGGRSPSRG